MKQISVWAKNHVYQARAYIILIKISLFFMAISIGKTIAEIGIVLPHWFFTFSAVIFLIIIVFYPNRLKGQRAKWYIYSVRKSCGFILCFVSFILILSLANTNSFFYNRASADVNATTISNGPPTAAEIIASLQYRDKSTLTRQEKRILKKEFGKQIIVYAKAKLSGDKATAGKVFLVILTIIGAVGLSLLLASLACSVACGGADGLAILIMVVGLTGIIWGMIALIKRIKKGKSNK